LTSLRQFIERLFVGGFGLVPFLTVFGARVHIHWSALALAGVLLVIWARQPFHAVECVCCYFGVILLHEAGHAAIARRLGYKVLGIYLSGIHGLCRYERPDTLLEDCLVAWGGVLAQMVVAVPVIALAHISVVGALPFAGIFIAAFGYFSLITAAFNLAPARGFDGAKAWRILPILISDFRAHRIAMRAARDLFKRLK
jgi:Zn-dependent protease